MGVGLISNSRALASLNASWQFAQTIDNFMSRFRVPMWGVLSLIEGGSLRGWFVY